MKDTPGTLTPYLSPLGAWALALGTSIGWGSFVITGTNYLSQGGPAGSILGLILGAAVMLVISKNYHYMINRNPDAGGVYAYARDNLGCDHGFLTAWFLALTYAALLWANATSIPLFCRYFLGGFFQVGPHYTIFGYQVFVTESALSMASIILVARLCTRRRRLTAGIQAALALAFTVGITVVFFAAMSRHDSASNPIQPLFLPGRTATGQILHIASISPWAFIGFENISHSAEEFRFSKKRTFSILCAAVLSATALYCFIFLLSVTALPPGCPTWVSYIANLSRYRGIQGLPAFFAARTYLGMAGMYLLYVALFALIVTSLIGNTLALSRLLFALARDEVLPTPFAHVNERGCPDRAVWAVAAVSILIPFFGRSAIDWIVDVTTIGATLTYAFVSICAYRCARREDRLSGQLFGAAGVTLMIFFGTMLLLQTLHTSSSMATESFFLFTVWAILGFLCFRALLIRDRRERFGRSIVVWIVLLSLILFTSLVWMEQTTRSVTYDAMEHIRIYYSGEADAAAYVLSQEDFIAQEMNALHNADMRGTLLVISLFLFSLLVMVSNYTVMRRRTQERESALVTAQNLANTDPLTGVKSKHAYVERESLVDKRIWEGNMEPFSIVICDLNNLKKINDTRGHQSGDEYIRCACQIVCQHFKHSPVFRVGGDEFAVLLLGQDYQHRRAIMARLCERFEENRRMGDVVMATGISDYDPAKDRRVAAVYERADREMYARKRALKKADRKHV